MGLPAETLKLLQDTAVEAAAVALIALPGDDAHVLIAHGGKMEERLIPPPRIKHTVNSLDDLIAFGKTVVEKNTSIWHNEKEVVLILDESDRRDRVTFPLVKSDELELLERLASDQTLAMPQVQFVRMLRIKLGLDPAIVNIFRTLDFKRRDGTATDLQHGRESLGKNVEASVQGTAAIPEELSVQISLYTSQGEHDVYNIRCAVEIDTANCMFRLMPFSGIIDSAMQAHQMDIEDRLNKEFDNGGVYYGTP